MKTELKRGEFEAYYPIEKLKLAEVNRDLFEKHAENFKAKLKQNDWMMPVVISNYGDVIEGHHRIHSAKLLKQKTVPAYIVDWVDTSKEKEHLNCIIDLNNGNRAWLAMDYIKAFASQHKDYNIVFKKCQEYKGILTPGNLMGIYFGTTVADRTFKQGKSRIKSLKFAEFLLDNIHRLAKTYGKRKIQSYCISKLITFAYRDSKMDKKGMIYLFNEIEGMAQGGDSRLTSIADFTPTIKKKYNDYKKIINESNR